MDQINEPFNPQHDDQLAEFADQVMQGKFNPPALRHGERTANRQGTASSPTDDLLGLKETILRLNSSFPPNPLDEAAIKRMQVRFKARVRRGEKEGRPSFWKKWFGRDVSPQLGLAFAVLALLVVVIVSAQSWTAPGSSTTGTASTPMNLVAVAGLTAMVLVLFWFMRRK